MVVRLPPPLVSGKVENTRASINTRIKSVKCQFEVIFAMDHQDIYMA